MESKYDVQVGWYVHSDQSSRSFRDFRVGHCPVWINYGAQDISMRK